MKKNDPCIEEILIGASIILPFFNGGIPTVFLIWGIYIYYRINEAKKHRKYKEWLRVNEPQAYIISEYYEKKMWKNNQNK